MNPRTLAIESVGDFFRRKTIPRIRIAGQWLERAGFKPGHRVALQVEAPGIITLRFQQNDGPGANEAHS